MSRKRKCKYNYNYNDGGVFPNFYMLLILVLIVLQWLGINRPSNTGASPGVLHEPNLISNGGLFIITLFLLAACSCEVSSRSYRSYKQHH